MSWKSCRAMGCSMRIREGLRRTHLGRGADGQELADGEFCWKCRRKHRSAEKQAKRSRQASASHARTAIYLAAIKESGR